MALAAVSQSVDGLPEALAKEYTRQADGMYRLDVEGGFKTADEVAGLVSALDKGRRGAARHGH